jgi:outer membrane protein assembly factor BamB
MPTLLRPLFLLSATVLLFATTNAVAQEWTRFRGPNGTGVGKPLSLPDNLTPQNIHWKKELEGVGHSSPVLWGDRLFITSANEQTAKRHLTCINAKTGQTLWSKDLSFRPYHHHELNNFASATPTVDSKNVYTIWTSPEAVWVYAYTHAGKEVWRRDLGATRLQHGGANSPTLVGNTLIVSVEQEGEGSDGSIYGLDCKNGDTLWRSVRKPSQGAPYATPVVHTNKSGKLEVIFPSTSHGFTSLDPKTGSRNWEVPNLFPLRCASSPVIVGGMVLATCGSGGGDKSAVAVRLPQTEGTQTAEIGFKIPRGVSYVTTPIVHEDRLYFWCDNGIVACYNGNTGKEMWRERVGGNYFGSPILSNGKIYAVSTRGELVSIAAEKSFRVMGRYELHEASHATPAVANGLLYVRTESHLFAIGK